MSMVSADPIHRLEREALARRIRQEERIRRLMRLYSYARWQAEEVEAASERIIAQMDEEELAAQRRAATREDGGEWLGVAAILALLFGLWALVRWAL